MILPHRMQAENAEAGAFFRSQTNRCGFRAAVVYPADRPGDLFPEVARYRAGTLRDRPARKAQPQAAHTPNAPNPTGGGKGVGVTKNLRKAPRPSTSATARSEWSGCLRCQPVATTRMRSAQPQPYRLTPARRCANGRKCQFSETPDTSASARKSSEDKPLKNPTKSQDSNRAAKMLGP
jgi:hypothetical protein